MDDSNNNTNNTATGQRAMAHETMDNRAINTTRSGVEQFTASDLITLRNELLQGSVDSFQAAQIVTNFLSGRGYGISSSEARTAASSIEMVGATAEHIQQVLETVALAM